MESRSATVINQQMLTIGDQSLKQLYGRTTADCGTFHSSFRRTELRGQGKNNRKNK